MTGKHNDLPKNKQTLSLHIVYATFLWVTDHPTSSSENPKCENVEQTKTYISKAWFMPVHQTEDVGVP